MSLESRLNDYKASTNNLALDKIWVLKTSMTKYVNHKINGLPYGVICKTYLRHHSRPNTGSSLRERMSVTSQTDGRSKLAWPWSALLSSVHKATDGAPWGQKRFWQLKNTSAARCTIRPSRELVGRGAWPCWRPSSHGAFPSQ